MKPLPMWRRRMAARLLHADQRTSLKRWAALALAASFFLPLFSCSGQPSAKAGAASGAAVHAAARAAAEPLQVDFTPAEAYPTASWQGVLAALLFAWPLAFLGADVLRRRCRRSKALGRVQLALCAASVAGIGWALWFGSHMPGFAPGAGAGLALGSLAVFAATTLRQIRSG